MLAAGDPSVTLQNNEDCIEVMTGAILPKGTDTVVMYEHPTKENNGYILNELPKKGQDIHYQGQDHKKDSLVLAQGKEITAAELEYWPQWVKLKFA